MANAVRAKLKLRLDETSRFYPTLADSVAGLAESTLAVNNVLRARCSEQADIDNLDEILRDVAILKRRCSLLLDKLQGVWGLFNSGATDFAVAEFCRFGQAQSDFATQMQVYAEKWSQIEQPILARLSG